MIMTTYEEVEQEVEEDLVCIQHGEDCAGKVEYRMALSGTGIPYPRCDKHWDERLNLEQGLRERYPEQPPPDWSHWDAGEYWSDADY